MEKKKTKEEKEESVRQPEVVPSERHTEVCNSEDSSDDSDEDVRGEPAVQQRRSNRARQQTDLYGNPIPWDAIEHRL